LWGQSLVEFALIIPLIMLLVMGIFDLGRLFYIKITLESASREGAYYLSYNPNAVENCSGGICRPNAAAITAIQAEAVNMGVPIVNPATNIAITGTRATGDPVTVTITQTVNLFILNFMTGPVTVSSQTRMMVQ
jgi:Flp pilus assembly protein TadG